MTRPRIFCDFNKRLDRITYGLNTVGTAKEAERLGLHLAPGIELTVSDYDGFEDGSPAWILAEGVVVQLPSGSLGIEVGPSTFRWEPREEPAK
jgi:hypothetical protein